MPAEDPPARMAPLTVDQFTDETRAFFDRWTVGLFKDADKNPPLMTYARHPKLADLFSQFNIHLLVTSTLEAKERQIAILRTAWLCDATYMWSSHLNTSLLLGLDPQMFAPIQHGADDDYFDDFERTIVRATDELVKEHEVSDATWSVLSARWSDQQMLDFLFTVGGYVLTAGVLRSTRVARDQHLLDLADQYGAPPIGSAE